MGPLAEGHMAEGEGARPALLEPKPRAAMHCMHAWHSMAQRDMT